MNIYINKNRKNHEIEFIRTRKIFAKIDSRRKIA